MPHPSHRLDLCVVPRDLSREAPDPASLFDHLARRGFTDREGAPGEAANDVVAGGFVRVRLDRPPRVALYANGQGGFRVFCPACGTNVTARFARSERRPNAIVTCDCGATTSLDSLDYRPPAAFGAWAVVIADANDGIVAPPALALFRDLFGEVRVIGRRVVV